MSQAGRGDFERSLHPLLASLLGEALGLLRGPPKSQQFHQRMGPLGTKGNNSAEEEAMERMASSRVPWPLATLKSFGRMMGGREVPSATAARKTG